VSSLLNIIYVIISGAGTARRTPALIEHLLQDFERVIAVPTENAGRVVSRRELALIEGIEVVDSYFDAAILPAAPDGLVLVAPCTFNSLNKLACGIADTLALSIAAEAIGRGTPVVVAVSVNPPLLRHPRTRMSIETLRSWGVSVVDPDTSNGWATLATDDAILGAVRRARAGAAST
jgi:phosphopantothenoylcysteine decarboxylase/phosphopantothenate--cysteine ligase